MSQPHPADRPSSPESTGTTEPPLDITPAEVRALLDAGRPLALLDCRTDDEYARCRIDGATLVPLQLLADHADDLDRTLPNDRTPIVVYCHHGVRSRRAALLLRMRGHAQARSMSGGIDRWSLEIDPRVPRY